MKNEELRYIEELVRASADLPRATVGFRKRVMRAARRVERERAVERQTRRALCLVGVAVLALIGLGPLLPRWLWGKGASKPFSSPTAFDPQEHPTKDWDLVESYEKDRSVRAGMMFQVDGKK